MDECICCKGKKKLSTDLWNKETMAVWEPCHHCCKEELKNFYNATEKERQNWYYKK